MDDSADPSDPDDDGLSGFATLVLHIIVGLLVGHVYKKCCCRRKDAAGEDQAANAAQRKAAVRELQPRKSLSSAYLLWLITGLVGGHHFYLDRVLHGLAALWTLNFLGIGWLLDGLLMPGYVGKFNGRLPAIAPSDTSRSRLFRRLPTVFFLLCVVPVLIFLYCPLLCQKAGLVDIERLRAQTEVNPYELLGLSRGASSAEAKVAYRKASLKWHPDRNVNCGKTCEDKMSEIGKAYDLIKKKQAPDPVDDTWERWIQDLGSDWFHVFEAMSKYLDEEEPRRPSPKPMQKA